MPNVNPGPGLAQAINVDAVLGTTPATNLTTYAALPSAAGVASGTFAYTSDLGYVYSNGSAWVTFSGSGYTKGGTWIATSGALTTPIMTIPIVIPTSSTLKEVTILTEGGSGSCVIDIWKTPLGSYPPTVVNSICNGLPTISAGITYDNSALTGWTTAFNADDTILFNLNSTSSFTTIAITLRMQ